jgi:hypothetical protein
LNSVTGGIKDIRELIDDGIPKTMEIIRDYASSLSKIRNEGTQSLTFFEFRAL